MSVDTGQLGSATSVTFTPNGDGVNDLAFVNFTLPQAIPYSIQFSKDNFVTIPYQYFGNGTTVRVSWNGQRDAPANTIAPPGLYTVRLNAAGVSDTTLSVNLQAGTLSGYVKNSLTT
jgi:hypothetical protein